MKMNIAIGVLIALSVFMSITVFAGWGFSPSGWTTEERISWSISLIFCIIFGVYIGYSINDKYEEKDS